MDVFEVVEMTTRQGFFNELAKNWDNRFQTHGLVNFLEKLVPMFGISNGQKVLDAGTGTGILIPFLLYAVGPTGHITAINFAEKMIRVCKSKYGFIPNVSFSVENIEQINYPSKSFDAVVCFGLFPHLKNRAEALRQIKRVLKPDGRLVIAHAHSSDEINAYHKKSSSIVAQDMLPKSSEMRRILHQEGFFRITITDESGCYLCISFKSPE
jgi:ubiquinone/menaquinone biosynthesis C-methylase UbiE